MRLLLGMIFVISAWTLPASASAFPVTVNYEGEVPEEIRDQIANRLPEEDKADSALQARRQARRATTIVEGVLNAYGYFDPTITTSVTRDGDISRSQLTVSAGARFSVRRLLIRYEGEPPREEDQEVARQAISLQPGMAAIAADVIDQDRRISTALREVGYPYAQTLGREVIGDREGKTISVRYTVSAGPRVRFGDIDIPEGLRTKDSYLIRINPVESGELFDPSELALYNSRLSETRLFDRSIAKLSDEPVSTDPDGTEVRDVELVLTERQRNTITLGAGFDTNEGFGVNAELLRRNFTGRGDLLIGTVRAAQREYSLDVTWRRPNMLGYGKGLNVFGSIADENTDAFNQQFARVGAGVEVIQGPQFQYAYGGEARYVRQTGEVGDRDFQVVALNGSMRIDRADSLLDPRRGWRAEGRLTPTYAFSPDGSDVGYIRALAQGRYYLPITSDARYVAAGRLRLGTLVGAGVADVPGDDRFFAGGGGSVRGYAFQGIGPFSTSLDGDDIPLGGRSLVEASVEGRARITETIGAVAFVDAGNVSDSEYPTFDNLKFGAGVGARYMTPAGPIRLDVAVPLNPSDRDDAFQVYISIGQAF